MLFRSGVPRHLMIFFFFSSRRRHTRSKPDWSSDVCSSDLRLADMAVRSVKLNNLTNQIKIIKGDLKLPQTELHQSGFDVVTCNPPYFKTPNDNEKNKNEHLTIARHEVCCTLEDVIKACKLYVRPGGKVALVHRPGRLVDILSLMRTYNLEP